ncbi:MAG: PAS domain S-box protein, partial [Bacteroidota bacterium]
ALIKFFNLSGGLQNKTLAQIFPFFSQIEERLQQIWAGQNIQGLEKSHRNSKLHQKLHFQINASSLPDDQGNIVYGLMIIKDISERKSKDRSLTNKRLKDALKAFDFTNDRLKCIINSTQDLIVAIDTNFRFILFNDRYQKSFEDLSGKRINLGVNILDCLSGLSKELVKNKKNWERVLKGEAFSTTDRLVYKDGTIHYFESQYNLVRGKDGGIIGASQITREVTDRIKTEEKWISSEKKFSKMFNEAGVGLALLDLKTGKIAHPNPALCQILSYEAPELAKLENKSISHPVDFREEQKLIQETIEGERVSYKMDKRIYSKEHEEIWASISGTIIHDANNEPEFILNVIENITDQKLIQKNLEDSEEQNRAL